MTRRVITAVVAALVLGQGPAAHGQAPPRAVRRTVPILQSFAHGLALGTRDSSGAPGPNYWQLWTDYTIEARLDPARGLVTGHEVFTFTNPGDSAMAQLALRLYQNRFTATGVRVRVPPSVTQGMTITRLVVNGVAVNLDSVAGDWSSTTLAMVRLANPIAAHATARVEAEWSVDIVDIPPGRRGGARGGRQGSRVFQVAQWYPQLAMYDDLRGWDRELHLGASEFYNNFGHFDVRLDLPAGWLAGATGQLVNAGEVLTPAVRERLAHATDSDSQITIVGAADRGTGRATLPGDRLVWHFTADSVNDFAWAASVDYVWDATRATIPGRGPIPVHLLYLPEDTAYQRTGAMARHALEFYSALWMPYAWSGFTQVDGPERGMEYPMLTMSGPGFGVTDHEIGHQWWPMMVGTNETWYGWMDEGFNEYMNILSGDAWRGRPAQLDSLGGAAGPTALSDAEAAMMWDNNYGGPFTTFVTYDRAPMMLSMLGGIVGDSAVARAMARYARSWRFRHPAPWDYMFAMNRLLGRNLDWFWYYWLFTTESSDGRIVRVIPRGRKLRVTVRQDGEMPSPVVLRVEYDPAGPRPPAAANAAADSAGVTFTWPVDVWFGGQREFTGELDMGRARVTRITLDPGARFPDRDRSDNVWTPAR